MSKITFSKINEQDIEIVLELSKKWQDEDITIGYKAETREELEEFINDYFFTAKIEERIVCYIFAREMIADDMSVFEDGDKYLEIDGVYVLPNYRDKNIGSELVNIVKGVAKENGVDRALIYSSSKDIRKILDFYGRHGFKSWNIQMYI